MNCDYCNKPLGRSQYSADDTLKSCPRCSQQNGREHVFYATPEAFGITPKRSTSVHPEGIQSHCVACRSHAESKFVPTLCHEVFQD